MRIGHRSGTNLFHAVRFALSRGRRINTHVTLSFTDLGLTEEEASEFFSAIRNGISRRWKREREQKCVPLEPLTTLTPTNTQQAVAATFIG